MKNSANPTNILMMTIPFNPDEMENSMVILFRQGEKSVYRLLYQHYGPAVLGILTRMLKDRQLAEKYVIQSFCEIWNKRLSYDPASERLFTWMLKIAKNCVAAEKQYSETIIREEINLIYATDIKAWLQERKRLDAEDFAAEVDETLKEALRLIYFESHSFAAVAEKLNLPQETLKIEIVKTIKKLKGSVLA